MRLLLILLLLGGSFFAQAQAVTGSWYGLAEASGKGNNTNNYLTELIIKQKGNKVEGIFSYYFRSGYQSYYVRGTYNPKTRLLYIKNLPVTYFKSKDIDGIDCPMDFYATLFASKVKSTLSGSFLSQEKYKYTCPELKFSYSLDINEKDPDSLIHSNTANVRKYWKPRDEDLVISVKEISTAGAMAERMTINAIKDSLAELKKNYVEVKKDSAIEETVKSIPTIKEDSADVAANSAGAKTDSATAKIEPAVVSVIKNDSVSEKKEIAIISPDSAAFIAAEKVKQKDLEKLVAAFEKRKTVPKNEIEIESDSVRISFYDNGVIDGDSITVFINRIPVLTHQLLAEKALNMYVAMDSEHTDTEISMFAENLGKYPPNTALMVITDGSKRNEVYLSSSYTQNSSVILKRKKR